MPVFTMAAVRHLGFVALVFRALRTVGLFGVIHFNARFGRYHCTCFDNVQVSCTFCALGLGLPIYASLLHFDLSTYVVGSF